MELLYRPNHLITQQQLSDCVATIMHLMGWLRRADDTPIEGNVQTSLEATIIRACNRLDKILDDETRWAVNPDHDAHTFATQNAALHNELLHAELKKRTEERDAVMAKIAHLTTLLNMGTPIDPAPKTKQPSRQQKKKQQ